MAEKKKLKALNPLVMLGVIVFLCFLASYVVPAGEYTRVMNETVGKELVVPGSFKYIEKHPVGVFYLFQSLALGIQEASQIIAFLFVIGGMFAIIDATGAMNAGLGNAVRKMKGRELLMIPALMVIFACGSAFAGNFEEFLAFMPLVIGVSVAMGFDSLTAIGIVYGAAAAGYAGAMTNPFTVGVAQGIAGLPMFSGIGLRAALFVTLLTVTILYVMFYARRVHRNPLRSAVREEDLEFNQHLDMDSVPVMTGRHKLVLLIFLATIIGVVYGVLKLEFYIDELAGLFMICGLLCGVVGGLRPGQIGEAFIAGCGNMLLANILIAMANASMLIMKEAHIMDTIIHALATLLQGMPPKLSACGMFVVQDIFNVLVPSGSGQAAITMPLMAPLAKMIGVSSQTSVLAFQMGDAFTNVLAPTSGEVVAACAMAHISFGKWFKWLLPLFVLWWIVAFVFLGIAVHIGYGPF